MARLQVSDLTFSYEGSGDNVFEDVSFSIDTSWKLGLIGRNGKGKSAILVWSHSKNLRPKVSTLGGYVYTFDEANGLVSRIKDLQKGVPG